MFDRQLGPLYTHSCFDFEDKNGSILKLIRGTQNIDEQIETGISFIHKLPERKQKCIEKDSICEKICESIENPNRIRHGESINTETFVFSKIKQKKTHKHPFQCFDYFSW